MQINNPPTDTNARQHFAVVEWFYKIVVDAGLKPFHYTFLFRVAGHENYVGVGGRFVGSNVLAELQASSTGAIEVESLVKD